MEDATNTKGNKWNSFIDSVSSTLSSGRTNTEETKQEAKTDIESNQTSSMYDKMSSSFSGAKDFVLGRQEPEPQGALAIFNCLPNTKSYMYAGIAFAVAALFLMMAFLMLPFIVLKPSKFVCSFSLGMCALLVGLAFLKGVRVYVKDLFIKKNVAGTAVLGLSLLLSLYFSLIADNYIWSIVFCVFQLNAIIFFFFKTSPIGMA